MPKGLIAIEGAGPVEGVRWPPLERVDGRPLILHAHDALRGAGVGSVVVVGTAASLAAVHHALDAAAPGTVTLELAEPGSCGDALLAAADWLAGDDVIVHSASGMLIRGPEPLRRAFAAAGGSADATIFFASPRAHDGTDAQVVTGLHVFSARILDALEQTEPEPASGRSLLDAIDRLAAAGGRVRAAVLESWRSWEELPVTSLS